MQVNTGTPAAGSAPGAGGFPSNGATAAASTSTSTELEALSCVSCRARKLKCCRTKPACTRCVKVKAECVYPESRRKPAFKRRNVKELEERLAQVEVLLKDAGSKVSAGGEANAQDGDVAPGDQPGFQSVPSEETVVPDSSYLISNEGDVFTVPMGWNFDNTKTSTGQDMPFSLPNMSYNLRADNAGPTSWELLGMGLFEALPPTEMMEELSVSYLFLESGTDLAAQMSKHQAYFTRQHPTIPIIHPTRYIQAFYSVPHLRPPMALQYAVWTMASLGHEKYSTYHDVFHRRCRHYLEEDELRGDGEHFVTVAHAQAWALMATAEARNMWFTRAAMSASRCIKLLHMMGLHRLDDPNAEFELAPTIAPPKDWTELEERRRVFWGAFAIDSHASISTGWPCLIDPDDVTTHLPSSEEAFNQCREETTCRLDEVFTGSPYSSFAAAAVICHLFNQIMKHVHHAKQDDNPHDFDYGKYWNRHRELDILVSSAFMYLPDNFRLPKHLKDPVAVHTNLNLHASTICLHNRAYEMVIEHNLPEDVKLRSKTRLEATAQEIVNIVKLTSHSNVGYKSPLVSLALYVASSVYISVISAEQGLKPNDAADLEFLLVAMEAIGKQYAITRSFLGQAVADIHRSGLAGRIRTPKVTTLPDMPDDGTAPPPCGANIPVFARSRISKHNKIMPPLPGRLPLNNPIGDYLVGQEVRRDVKQTEFHPLNSWSKGAQMPTFRGDENNTPNKRKRVELSPEEASDLPSLPTRVANERSTWGQSGLVEEISSSDNTPPVSGMSAGSTSQPPTTGDVPYQYSLPHRAGSSTTGSSPSAAFNSSSTPSSSGISPSLASGQIPTGTLRPVRGNAVTSTADIFHVPPGLHQINGVDLDMLQSFRGWDVSVGNGGPTDGSSSNGGGGSGLPAFPQQATQGVPNGGFVAGLDDESWMIMNDAAGLKAGHSWDAGLGQDVG